jgi:hypothetical protein
MLVTHTASLEKEKERKMKTEKVLAALREVARDEKFKEEHLSYLSVLQKEDENTTYCGCAVGALYYQMKKEKKEIKESNFLSDGYNKFSSNRDELTSYYDITRRELDYIEGTYEGWIGNGSLDIRELIHQIELEN